MIHPHTELKYISDEVGYGLVAKQVIPQGSIIWVLDELDREFTPDHLDRMSPDLRSVFENYTFRNNKGNYVLCWDHGRFMNHSFNSNCMATPYNFEIAIRDIQPGEQLTDDYGYLNIIAPFKAEDEGTHRKFVYPDDLITYHKEWDEIIADNFSKIPTVEQALRPYLSDKLWNDILLITKGEKKLESILLNYYNPEMVDEDLV